METEVINKRHLAFDYDIKNLQKEDLIHIYKHLLTPRLIEEKMIKLLRMGKVSKWFSGIGQEAISVGATLALQEDEYILPMHRNLGVFTTRNTPLEKLFCQFQGKMNGFTKGRDRSFHFGTNEHHIVGMISHLGPQLAIAGGIALADILEKQKRVTLVFTGDGGASEGDFHEALNVAAVWNLPVIFMVENNGYGLSTPSKEQFKFNSFLDKGPAYGIEAIKIDGNNILEVLHAVRDLSISMKENPRPVLIDAITFRMRGHEEASGTKYVPKELFEKWALKDPVTNFENFLLDENYLTPTQVSDIRNEINAHILEKWTEADETPAREKETDLEIKDVYQEFSPEIIKEGVNNAQKMRFVNAISDGLRLALQKYPNLILMGQDIADYGGVFKVTEGFLAEFGQERIRNTPLCESAIIGIALGLSIRKHKGMVEMQFADFVTCGFNQIINNLAKSHYRWGQNADVVIRMPTGAGANAGPFHSQSNEAWFFHTPGLKIVYPSTPEDAKGLLLAAFEDPNPILYFEHKSLYRSISAEVDTGYYTTPIGKANVVEEGEDVVIITYGYGVHWALDYMKNNPDCSMELIDLRTLLPWDKETVFASIRKIGKGLILHEDCLTGGIGGEIAACINEHCFESLDAPIQRVGGLDTPIPFCDSLEKDFLPIERFKSAVEQLLNY